GVGATCRILNQILPYDDNQVFVEDKKGVLSLIDFSDEQWNEIHEYPIDNVQGNILNVFDGHLLYAELEYTSETISTYPLSIIRMNELETGYQDELKFNISSQIVREGDYSIRDNSALISSNGNWILFLMVLENQSQSDRLLFYRYNLSTKANMTIMHQTNYEIELWNTRALRISDDGTYAFTADFLDDDLLVADFKHGSVSEIHLENDIQNGWIESEFLYFKIDFQAMDHFITRLDIETGEQTNIIELDDLFPDDVLVLEDYILLPHTHSIEENLLSNLDFNIVPILGMMFALAIISDRKPRLKL
ncbi:MAG: hypothetical protein ACXAD7_18630, partial [Candidatus Kariarchaeaceae archaeon]